MTKKLKNIDLNLVKVLDAIMVEGSISRAAERLTVSQPAISNALARLRAIYNDELFVRTSKGMVPTARASEIMGSVRGAIEQIESTLVSDHLFNPAVSHRKFTVSLTDYGELYFLPHLMNHLGKVAPDIDIICVPDPGATLGIDMKSGMTDLVWDWKDIDDDSFVSHKIFEDRGFCIARRGHPRIKDRFELEDFLNLEHVVLRPTRTHVPRVERELEKMGLERKVVTEVSRVLVIPYIVATTDLIGVIPERLARQFASQLDLDIFPNPLYDDTVSVYQMWHKQYEKDAGHKWFRELLVSLTEKL